VDRLDGLWSPVADLEETETSYIVEVELPGAKKDDVTVEFRDGELAISGEIREREYTGRIRWKTRRSGRFDYLVTMPGDADPDKISASLADGVLTITVPKSEKSKPRRISVFASESPLEGKVLGQGK
jgi:HSP20 family protein